MTRKLTLQPTEGESEIKAKGLMELHVPNLSPIPVVEEGLANVVTVYAVYHNRVGEVALLIFMCIILGNMFSGQAMPPLYILGEGSPAWPECCFCAHAPGNASVD